MNEEMVQEILQIINSTITGKCSLHGKVDRINEEMDNFCSMGTYMLDQPIKSRNGISGKIIKCVKRFFRKFTRWYVKPAFDYQNEVNKKIRILLQSQAALLENLVDEIDKKNCELKEIQIQYEKLYDFTENLKKKYFSEVSINDIDYFSFENENRGDENDIARRQEIYLDVFKDCDNVLDIGCGRGEFVTLLTKNGISAKGIDVSKEFVQYCQEKGLQVEQADMFEYLKKAEDHSLGGIFCSQVIEHIMPDQILQLLNLANQKLKDNAPIILETINPQNVVAVSNWFYMDPTHIRPVHPKTLEFMLESCGFKMKETRFLHTCKEDEIPPLNLEGSEEFDRKLERVNEVLFGPQDYACIAYRNGDVKLKRKDEKNEKNISA